MKNLKLSLFMLAVTYTQSELHTTHTAIATVVLVVLLIYLIFLIFRRIAYKPYGVGHAADSNKLRRSVQNEVTLIFTKFGADLTMAMRLISHLLAIINSRINKYK